MPIARAPRANQDSRVSFHPRGPHTSISISFALTVAEVTADSFVFPVGLFDISASSLVMIPLMTKKGRITTDERPTGPKWVRLGTIAARVAARLSRCDEISAQLGGEPVEPGNQ